MPVPDLLHISSWQRGLFWRQRLRIRDPFATTARAIVITLIVVKRNVGNVTIEIVVAAPFESIDSSGFVLIVAGHAAGAPSGTLLYDPEVNRLEFTASGGTVIRVISNDPALAKLTARRTVALDFASIHTRVRSALLRSDAAAPLALRSAALHIIARSIRARRHRDVPSWLVAARHIIDSQQHEAIRPHDVAAAVGVAPARLAKAFRREFGESMSAAMLVSRIRAAIEELRESKRSTREIARRCGFYDVSQLARSLDAATGMRPAAFRTRQ